jgi:hypothetical protein
MQVAVSWALYNGLENASKGSFLQFTLFLGSSLQWPFSPSVAHVVLIVTYLQVLR